MLQLVFISGCHFMITSSFIICSTLRTGSTLLANALEWTGFSGYPNELFNEA
jgi:LPS sulfotransferase NodH